jgi:hypothetical protein
VNAFRGDDAKHALIGLFRDLRGTAGRGFPESGDTALYLQRAV